MKKLTVFLIVLMAVLCYTAVAREITPIGKVHETAIPTKVQNPLTNPLPPGTYTVGVLGDFPSIDSAFTRLSVDGVAGPVTLELIDLLYVAPTFSMFTIDGPIPGAGPESRVTIKPATDLHVTIEGSAMHVLWLVNTSYLTIDGVGLMGTTTLTIHALYNNVYSFNDCVDFLDNSDYNIVQNVNFICDDVARPGGGLGFYTSALSHVAPDNNLIQSNFFKKAGIGIYVSSYGATVPAIGNTIRGNFIGSETDSLIAEGILLESNQGTIVENNIAQNFRSSIPSYSIACGVWCYAGNSCIIRNNVVKNITSAQDWGSVGIFLTGSGLPQGERGVSHQVYNNMIYDIRSTSTQPLAGVNGIQTYDEDAPKIYYNTIYLSGTGVNRNGSAALWIDTLCTGVDVKNNILINMRDESPYISSSIYDLVMTNLTSDHNDLFWSQGANNCAVRIGHSMYNTLEDWQVMGRDLNSMCEMASFVNPDLHISELAPTNLESHGIPISGIGTDFDGNLRNPVPDIGADEFDGIIVGVNETAGLPDEYFLGQNYPNPFNPSTTIQFSIVNRELTTLKVYDLLGREVATLMNEVKERGTYTVPFDAATLATGIYFYRLTAGTFTDVKRLVLLR